MRTIKPWSNTRFLALSLILFISGMATTGWAATCTSNSGARSWNTAASWDCAHVPATGDAVVIAAGSTVTLNVDSNTIASLTVNSTGTLTVATGTSFDLYLGGSLTNNGTINFAASSSTNTIYLAGTNVTSTWSGTGTWNLDNADLNGKNPKSCSGSCDIELIGSPLLHFANQTLFSGLGTSFTFNAAGNSTATVDLNFAGSQTIATTNVKFPNLTLTGTGAKTPASGTLTVLGSMTIGNGITVNADSNDPTINIGGSLSIGSGATYTASNNGVTTITGSFSNSGTYTGNSAAVNVGGNFSNTSAFTSGSGTWTFNGTSAVQNFTTAATFQRLTLNNSLGFSLGSNVTVSTLLTLSAGPVVTGANLLLATANCPGSISRTSGYVAGNLQLTVPSTNPVTCLFPVGDTNNYAPISITKTGSNSGTLTGATATGDHADTTAGTSGIDATRSVNRTWTLTAGTLSGSTPYSAIFQFCNAVGSGCGVNDVDAGASFGSFLVAEKVAAWSLPTVANPTATSIQATGLTSFGVFAVGEAVLPTPLAEYRMDEASWNGTANEVVDSSGNGNHAQAFNSANTTDGSRAIAGSPGTCRYGVFDNGGAITQGYVQTPLPNLTSNFTITAWIRTTNNTVAGQRILIDDQNNTGGYGLSLSDGTAGLLRFYSRGITPTILDSTYTIANNTWYFVAAVADITNKKRTIYVFNQTGVQLSSTTESAWTAGTWGTDAGPVSIGGEVNGPPQTELPASFHFRGNIDEVRVYQKALNSSDLTTLAKATHTCASAGPDHYELSLPTSSITCLPSTATVTACADNLSPCTPYGAASGTTATLATSAGTLGATTVTFNASGVASTTLSYPAAADGASASVTLSGEQITASNLRKCCPNGVSCVAANSCSSTFNTTGFVFSGSAGGSEANISAQVAGTASGTYYLRAVKTDKVTKACETALSGANTVNFAYECVSSPSTCYGSDLMSVNGGASTVIARNNSGSVSSYTSVPMTFDANGNASFTFKYTDVGQVRLYASKAASGTLLSTLTGSSNAFVVKPYAFTLGNVMRTSDNLANPVASDASGSAFMAAGDAFKATVTAIANGGTTTPSFGRCDNAGGTGCSAASESVSLASTLVSPASGAGGSLGGTTANASNFVANAGAYTFANLTWSEVGIITLKASNSNYLSNGLSTCSTSTPGENCQGTFGISGNIGRFIPHHFVLSTPSITPAGGTFSYMDQPFGIGFTLTAVNAGGGTTVNYATSNSFAKLDPTSTALWPSTTLGSTGFAIGAKNSTSDLSTRLSLSGTPTGSWSGVAAITANLQFSRPTTTTADATWGSYDALDIGVAPQDSDGITLLSSALDLDASTPTGNERKKLSASTTKIRFGRLRLINAYGSELLPARVEYRAEYWDGSRWTTNTSDTTTSIPCPLPYVASTCAVATGGMTVTGITPLNAGVGFITFPALGAAGFRDIAINLNASSNDTSCNTAPHSGAAANLPWLKGYWGAKASCGNVAAWLQDPNARVKFGSPKAPYIYLRERY